MSTEWDETHILQEKLALDLREPSGLSPPTFTSGPIGDKLSYLHSLSDPSGHDVKPCTCVLGCKVYLHTHCSFDVPMHFFDGSTPSHLHRFTSHSATHGLTSGDAETLLKEHRTVDLYTVSDPA